MAKKTSYWGGGGSWANWGGFDDDYFSKWSSSFTSAEEKRTFKNEIKDEALKEYVPIDIRINNSTTYAYKKRKLILSINDGDFEKVKKNRNKIVSAYDKIPYNSDAFYSSIFKERIGLLVKDLKNASVVSDYKKDIDDYFEGRKTIEELKKCFDMGEFKKSGECNMFGKSQGGYSGGKQVGTHNTLSSNEGRKRVLKLLHSKIKPQSVTYKEESLRKGKKINKAFINKTSYKPLTSKTVVAPVKKNLFIIVDCSGSMGRAKNAGEPAEKALSFIAGMYDSHLFNMDYVILHSNTGWENVAPKFKKGEFFTYAGGSEGFEAIDDNLEDSRLQGIDYVLAITDLDIGSQAQQGLYNYLKKGKKHLVLSFNQKGTMAGMNTRCIKTGADMINAFATITS